MQFKIPSFTIILVVAGLILLANLSTWALDQTHEPSTVVGVPRVEERLVPHGKGMMTDYYVVISGEVFKVRNNLMYGCFDNFSRVADLKEKERTNEPATVTVVGFGKGFIFDYRNIVEVK